jgi:hypothetical protein
MPLFSCLVGNDYTLAHETILRDLHTKMGVLWGKDSRHVMIEKVAKFVSKIPESVSFPMNLIESKSPKSQGFWKKSRFFDSIQRELWEFTGKPL